MIAPQQLVEQVLARATVDETIVIVTDASEASLRWAGNSMTTNGVSTSRRWTVISIVRSGQDARVGIVTSASVDVADIDGVVRSAEISARAATPASDAMPLLTGTGTDERWEDSAQRTEIGAFEQLAQDLSMGFDGDDQLYGFAHHQLHTTWLGTSTGIRRRFVQRPGRSRSTASAATPAPGWAPAPRTSPTWPE